MPRTGTTSTTGTFPRLSSAASWTVREQVREQGREQVREQGREQGRAVDPLLNSCLDTLREGVAVCDLQQRIQHVNRALCVLTGLSPERLEGQDLALLWADDGHATDSPLPWSRISDRESWSGRLSVRRADDQTLTVDASVRRIADSDGGGQRGYVVALQEALPAPVQSAEELDRLQNVGRLAAGTAHDCNNHLSVILNYTYILANQLADRPLLREHLQEMQQAAWQAARLNERLLDWTRRKAPRPRSVDPNRAVRDLSRSLEALVGRGIRLRTKLVPELWQVASLAPLQLDHVLLNLVLSARDSLMGHGFIEISTYNTHVREPLSSMGGTVALGPYAVLEVKCWDGEEHSPRDSQPVFRGTTFGVDMALDSIQAAGGYLVHDPLPAAGGHTMRIYMRARPMELAPAPVD